MMRDSRRKPARGPPPIPDGWHPINPSKDAVHPTRPTDPSSHHDRLGLARAVHPLNMKVPRILERDVGDRRGKLVRSSPRHQKLQHQDQPSQHNQVNHLPHQAHFHVADAFAPNKSLRLASLKPLAESPGSPTVQDTAHSHIHTNRKLPPQSPSVTSRAARLREATPPIIPLHEAIRTFDDAVDASPLAESNQVAVSELFLASWMERFESDRPLYKSIVVHAEIAFQELYRLTANITHPNDLVTAFACRILDDMVALFGPYSLIMEALATEIRGAIYATPTSSMTQIPTPYFAIVKHQKRILQSLRQDLVRRRDRNDLLQYEIDKVHATFRHFLDQCGLGLLRTVFREWYSVAVTAKRNSKKYIEYFSAWFGGSAKALVPRLFLAWKHAAVERRVALMHTQLASDHEKLAAMQKQVDELGVQRDMAQVESLAIRNDRKQAEDAIQRLHRKIQSASAFLETSLRREPLVAHEGQLRVEAATFLPPLVLEALLRGVHGVGYLQPLHGEFVLTSDDHKQGRAPVSVLQHCLSVIRGPSATEVTDQSADLSLDECAALVQNITRHIEGDRTAHMLFLSALAVNGEENEDDREGDEDDEEEDDRREELMVQRQLDRLVRGFQAALGRVRHQDEHYARHAKLFSSRILEHSEISVEPLAKAPIADLSSDETTATSTVLASLQLALGSDLGVINGVRRFSLPLLHTDQSTQLADTMLLRAEDLVMSPLHSRAFMRVTLAQLLGGYGSLLFSPADLSPFVKNRMLQRVMLRGIAGAKHLVILNEDAAAGSDDASTTVEDDDDEEGDQQAEAQNVAASPPRRRMLMAPRRMSSYRGLHAPIARGIDRGLTALVSAYDLWNRLSRQLVDADLVQARATTSLATDDGTGASVLSSDAIKAQTDRAIALLRPRLHLHTEPLPTGALMTAAKDKDRSTSDPPTTPTTGHRRSMASTMGIDWSYDTAKIRRLSLEDTQHLTGAVKSLHDTIVRATAQQRIPTFAQATATLKQLRLSQWDHACDLANQFLDVPDAPTAASTTAADNHSSFKTLAEMGGEDERRHVYECLSFDNDAIQRLFSVEPQPNEELARVHAILERKKHLVRHALYSKHRPGMVHAASLEELWHVVKLLRLPRDVRVLPPMRDDELLLQGYEQLFSPDDVTEVVLQLCNEQFLPHVTPLSARVELLVSHHLPLATQNQSAMREILHKHDVKKALGDHGQTLRTIFRRYCAKDKELMAAAAAKRRAAVIAATTAASVSASSPTASSSSSSAASQAPHGITKFMRLADWHEFISDYKLLRARFTVEYATTVFRNVQEAESGLEDHLEMIYSEFCEAVVALSVCFFPDPFLKPAARVHQFIRRYLPVSPEELRDHHI